MTKNGENKDKIDGFYEFFAWLKKADEKSIECEKPDEFFEKIYVNFCNENSIETLTFDGFNVLMELGLQREVG